MPDSIPHTWKSLLLGWCAWALTVGAMATPQPNQSATAMLTMQPARAELLDKVVAVAGRELITLRDVEEDLRLTYLELGAPQMERLPRAFFERRLGELIDRRLLYQYSEQLVRRDIPEGQPTMTPEMQREVQTRVEESMRLMRSHFETETQYRAELKRWGLSVNTLYQRLLQSEEQNLIISMALGQQIQLPAEEVNAYREELAAKGESLFRYRLLHIFLRYPAGATPQEKNAVLAQALDIGLKVRSGRMTFEDAARENSQAPGGREGGDLGYVESRDLAEPIRDALAYARPGEITTPLESNDGYHIFKVLEKQDARDFLWERKFRERRREIMQELHQTMRVEQFEF